VAPAATHFTASSSEIVPVITITGVAGCRACAARTASIPL
jgi:hypothetical protein